jgi:hypothetical protein
MFEIKDKEKSALKGLEVFKDLGTILSKGGVKPN